MIHFDAVDFSERRSEVSFDAQRSFSCRSVWKQVKVVQLCWIAGSKIPPLNANWYHYTHKSISHILLQHLNLKQVYSLTVFAS